MNTQANATTKAQHPSTIVTADTPEFTVVFRDGTEKKIPVTEHLKNEIGKWGMRALLIHSHICTGGVKYVVDAEGQRHTTL